MIKSSAIQEKIYELRWELCYFLFFLVLFSVFWTNAITFNDRGDLVAGHANLWGDWAIHFTMGSAMAYRELIPTTSPLMLDADFSYPFTTNLISAGLIRMGVPFYHAFVIPSFIFCMFLITAIYAFFRIFLQSRYLALFAACLFFFNGGVGIYYYLSEALGSSTPLTSLVNPLHEYTNYEPKHIKWISVISSMMFPQRSFALGAGVCLVALSLIFYSFQLLKLKNDTPSLAMNITAGVLLGFLPILHTHSFLAAFIILGFWCIADLLVTKKQDIKSRVLQWLVIVGVTSLIALPILFKYFIGNVGGHFFKWFPGWYAKEFNINWFVMWFKNWTFVPFLGFIGFAMLIAKQASVKEKWHAALIIAPGILLFLVPNLFLTQPWLWDNTKLFIWSSVFISPMAAYATFHIFKKEGPAHHAFKRFLLWAISIIKPNHIYTVTPVDSEDPQETTEIADSSESEPSDLALTDEATLNSENNTPPTELNQVDETTAEIQYVKLQRHFCDTTHKRVAYWSHKTRKLTFIVLALFMCSSGFLDAYYTARTDLHGFTMYNKNELELAEWVKENTSQDSVWLTSTKHNHWLFNLTGRQALMTYTGWLWTHGYNYQGVERDAKRIFRTGNRKLVENYGLDYIILDNSAKKDMGAKTRVLDKNFTMIKRLGQYKIYSTR